MVRKAPNKPPDSQRPYKSVGVSTDVHTRRIRNLYAIICDAVVGQSTTELGDKLH